MREGRSTNGATECVRLLISKGADIHIKDAQGLPALSYVDKEIVQRNNYLAISDILRERILEQALDELDNDDNSKRLS